MRIPTDEEYDRLVETTGGDDEKMHWCHIMSWVNDVKNQQKLLSTLRAARGCYSPYLYERKFATNREANVGFRPAFEFSEVDVLAPNGELSIVGTLYMDGQPIEVPQKPDESGDVVKYIPGAKLEIRQPLGDPAFIVTGHRVGDVVVADRVLLNQISYNDIEFALSVKEAK